MTPDYFGLNELDRLVPYETVDPADIDFDDDDYGEERYYWISIHDGQ